jgi:hypothetical protein
MITPDELVVLWQQRRSSRSPIMQSMAQVAAHYEGAILVPIPEMEQNARATVANLVQQGLDETAMRTASTLPMLWCPPVNPNRERDKKRAEVRRKALYGMWEANRMGLKLRRRARHLIGYGCSPVVLTPDEKTGLPKWHVRDPLTTYPADSADPDCMTPLDCLFTYQRSAGWVQKTYPNEYLTLGRPRDASRDTNLTVLEYHDADETVLMVVSDYGVSGTGWGNVGSAAWTQVQGNPRLAHKAVLTRAENRIGRAQVVVPGRITLGRIMGQFDGVLPMFAQRAHLEALQTIAVEKAIFPDAYLVSRPNEVAKFIVGPFDGRTGQVNVVEGGTVEYLGQTPGVQTNVAIDRLERNERVSSGVPAQFGGEAPTNVRTGRMGDSMISAQIDFGIQESQEILAASLTEENKLAIALTKAHFGDKARSFYVGWKNASGQVDYVPNEDFESEDNVVTFPAGGQDQAGLVIGIGQRIGMGTMSKETGQELDPMISDPTRERQRVMIETVDTAILSSVATAAQSGQMSPVDAALLKRRLVLGDSIEDALEAVQKKAQERQAPAVDPVDPNSPEAQAGIAPAGMGAEAAIAPPAPAQTNLSDLLTSLRGPTRMTPAERGAA